MHIELIILLYLMFRIKIIRVMIRWHLINNYYYRNNFCKHLFSNGYSNVNEVFDDNSEIFLKTLATVVQK